MDSVDIEKLPNLPGPHTENLPTYKSPSYDIEKNIPGDPEECLLVDPTFLLHKESRMFTK